MLISPPLIGIDVGSSSIKIVELKGGVNKKLTSCVLEPLTPGIIVNGAIANPDAFTESLSNALKAGKIGTRGKRAALSLGGSSVIIKKLEVDPGVGKADLADQVFYEAQQHFAEDFDSTYYTFYKQPPVSNSSTTSPVLLIGAKSEVVDEYVMCVRNAGMRVGLIDCDVFSTFNMFEENYGIFENLIALINVGASATQITILANGVFLFSRDVSIGGEDYTSKISDALSCDRMAAEEKKLQVCSGRQAPDSHLTEIFTDLNDQLVSEIKMTLDFFFQSGDVPPELNVLSGIYLVGGGARTLGLDAAIAAAMQIPIKIVDPFHKLNTGNVVKDPDAFTYESSSFGVAIGLAKRKFKDSE